MGSFIKVYFWLDVMSLFYFWIFGMAVLSDTFNKKVKVIIGVNSS